MNLIVENLTKSYKDNVVLKDVNFTFDSGKIYGLIGRNGAGKTTFFNSINKDVDIDKGQILLDDDFSRNIDINDIKEVIKNLKIRSNKVIIHKLQINRQRLEEIKNRYIFKNPMNLYLAKEQQFDITLERLKTSIKNLTLIKKEELQKITSSYIFKDPTKIIDNKKNKYVNILGKLETLSPLKTLKRGYTFTKKDGKVITTKKDLKKNDLLEVEFVDGTVNTKVI